MNKKTLFLSISLIGVCVFCMGCGETMKGMSKDAHRMGKGVRTIFVSDE